AHGLLAAAVAATGGNNALTAAGAAISAEAAAPVLAHYLYGKAAADLNADEKATISSITSLVGAGVGATTGADANLAQGAQSAGTAVDNNFLTAIKQYPEFGQEMEAACAMSAEACQETRQKWYDLSVKQSGLTEEGVVAWHEKLDATFKNLYAQCQGDTSCVAYLDLQKESASITHLGLHEELGVLGINLKHTLDIQQGNWGTLALDALADFGDFIPAVTTKPISQGVDKLVELGGEVFVLSKGVWSKATGSVADSAKSVAQTQQLRHELFDNFTGTKAQIKQAEITINGHLIKANPQISEGAAIFDGVSEQDVMSYFKQLTGVDNLPKAEKIPHLKDLDGNQAIFYAVKKDGLTYNLRNGSSSIDKTKARWTIEVTGVKGYQVGERVLTRKFVEVKFR
ncbi:VENN motif pre-toxin domain-containing protein, partial [Oligella urethralis]